MSDIAASTHGSGGVVDLDHKPPIAGRLALMAVLLAGLAFTAMNITSDINHAGEPLGVLPCRALTLVIAPGFEFVNGFHDTANAVATVIYTQSLPPAAR